MTGAHKRSGLSTRAHAPCNLNSGSPAKGDRSRPTPPSAWGAARHAGPPGTPPDGAGLAGSYLSGQRCSEKGCVFPAAWGDTGKCLHHHRQQREPGFFHSHQPTMLLLDRAKFGLPDSEPEDSRAQDRRRLAALWEAFLEGPA